MLVRQPASQIIVIEILSPCMDRIFIKANLLVSYRIRRLHGALHASGHKCDLLNFPFFVCAKTGRILSLHPSCSLTSVGAEGREDRRCGYLTRITEALWNSGAEKGAHPNRSPSGINLLSTCTSKIPTPTGR